MITGSVVTLALALSGHGVWSLVFGNLAMATTKSVGVLVVTRFAVVPTFHFHGLGRFFSFGAKISGQKILWYVRSQIDVILVGKLLGNEALGVYSVALNLARLPITKVAALVNQVAFPSYSRLQNEPERAAGYFFTSVKLGAFITFPLFWGMSSVAPEIVDVLLGDQWREATIVMQLLTIVMPLQFLSLLLFPLIDGLGHPGVSLRNITTSFVILTISLVAGIYWGLTGLCIGFVLGTGLSFIINFHRSMPLIDSDMSSLSRAVAPSLVSAAVMYVIVVAAKTFLLAEVDGAVRLIALILVGAAAFGAMTLTVNRRVVHDSVAIVRVRA